MGNGMASEASWQTGDTGDLSESLPVDEPMDQRTVESLLRRLMERVEDSERRYGEALGELHARLDQLSLTTEAARETSAPEDDGTFDRLQSEVSDLTRQIEDESATSLDDFERLGRALTGGLKSETPNPLPDPFEPEPSPFAQAAAIAAKSQSALALSADPYADDMTPAPSLDRTDLDKRLVDMAERLERSIDEAMPTSAIQSLNTRLDEIGNQLSQSLETAPSREALEHVERQISDMGQQLNRAEEQLGKVGGVEEHLHKLIERLDQKDTETPAALDPMQLQDIAAKAATEAARIVADDSKKTTERLDALHRDLSAMSDNSRQSGDKLVSTLEAVHESLKQLVNQVERGNSFMSGPRPPFAERPRQADAPPTVPFAQPSAPQTPKPQAAAPRPQEPQAPQAKAAPRMPEMNPHMPDATGPDDSPDLAIKDPDVAVKDQKLRDRLGAAMPDFNETETPPPFGRGKPSPTDQGAFDLDAKLARTAESPDDLVAAARRAAQAAAARAEERDGRRAKMPLAGSGPAEPGRRKRSWLMIAAATLLVVSALLLYGRLGSKPEPVPAPPSPAPAATEETAPAPAAPEADAKAGESVPNRNATPPATPEQSGSDQSGADQSGAWTPPPDIMITPMDLGQAATGLTEMAKGQMPAMPASELSAKPQLASLKPTDGPALPPDVVFSVEEPDASDAKAPMAPAALGPLPLRKAASEGYAAAQFELAVRYADGKGTKRDAKMAAEWFERAGRGGLAPAQYRLAAMYERGVGVGRDLEKARAWYKAAAENGNVKAMHNLAVSVSGREGGSPDYAFAAKWYGKAAAHGLSDSQFNLGILAEHGLGTTKNLRDAYKWYALAAAKGDAEATKRRDVVAVQLAPETLAKVEAEVKAWTAAPAIPAANEVAENPAWTAKATASRASNASSLVTRAQTLLNKLGYDVGPPDGVVGARTRAEIKRFQSRNGLEETGEVSVPLVSQLERLNS